MNRSSIVRSGYQYNEYCLEHCMGLVVTLQYNGTRDLRGCMIMQSTTWPWRVGVTCCLQSNALQSKRTWRIRESCLRLVPELRATVCDAVVGFNCDWCSSRLLSSSTANQNDWIQRVRAVDSTRVKNGRSSTSMQFFVLISYWSVSPESIIDWPFRMLVPRVLS